MALTREDILAISKVLDERLKPLETQLGGVDQRLDGIDGRLDRVDQRLDGIDGRLDGVDQRLDGIDGRLDGVDQCLDGIDGRLDGVDQRFDEMQVTIREVENTVLEELDRVQGFLEKRLDRLQANYKELEQYYRIKNLENENSALLLQMVLDLKKEVDNLKSKIA